jgi:hypothetical protein
VRLHVPAATKDTVDPLTVHTDVVEDAYETASELDAEADKANEPSPSNCEAGSAKVIDCAVPKVQLMPSTEDITRSVRPDPPATATKVPFP